MKWKARVEPQTLSLGRRSKEGCEILQRMDLCTQQESAKLIFHSTSGKLSLNAFGSMLHEMTGIAAKWPIVSEKDFLSLSSFSIVKYNIRYVVTGFSRSTE